MRRNGASRASLVVLATLAGMVGWDAAAPAQERLWKQVGARNQFPSFGTRVRSGGDIDGDGIWDVLVGDSDYPDAQGNPIGAAWIFSGVDGSLVYRLSPKSGVNESFGSGVAIGPDVDGDGHAELFVTAPNATPAGAAYLYSGSDASVKWSLSGSTGNNIGGISATVSDHDGDGLADFAMGCRTTTGFVKILSSASGSEITTISDPSTSPGYFGSAIENAGDVNADGVDDLIVGDESDSTLNLRAGAAFVFSGTDGSTLYEIYEQEQDAAFGRAVAGLGDLDGDGCSEFIVAAPRASSVNGKAVVHSGKDGSVIRTYTGASSRFVGRSVASAGDMNGDGIPEYCVGGADTVAEGVWLLSGRDGRLLYHFLGSGGFFSDGFGASCASLGDVDGDGRPDMVIGAPFADYNAIGFQGAIYAISGNDWFLNVSDRFPIAGEIVTFTMAQTNATSPAAMFLVDVNGAPTPALLAVGNCDTTGRYVLFGAVPSGLTGVYVGLLSIGVDPGGRFVDSDIEQLFFQ